MKNISMTDNLFEFRNYILEDLIEKGHKYIARDKVGAIYAYSSKPIRREKAWILEFASVDDTYQDISLVSALFYNIKWEDKAPTRITHIKHQLELHICRTR